MEDSFHLSGWVEIKLPGSMRRFYFALSLRRSHRSIRQASRLAKEKENTGSGFVCIALLALPVASFFVQPLRRRWHWNQTKVFLRWKFKFSIWSSQLPVICKSYYSHTVSIIFQRQNSGAPFKNEQVTTAVGTPAPEPTAAIWARCDSHVLTIFAYSDWALPAKERSLWGIRAWCSDSTSTNYTPRTSRMVKCVQSSLSVSVLRKTTLTSTIRSEVLQNRWNFSAWSWFYILPGLISAMNNRLSPRLVLPQEESCVTGSNDFVERMKTAKLNE